MLALVLCELQPFGTAEPVAAESLALSEGLQSEGSDRQVESIVRSGRFLLAACAAHEGENGEGAAPSGDSPRDLT